MPFRPMPSIWYSIYFRVSAEYIVFTCTRTCTQIECLSMRKWFVLDGWIVSWLADWLVSHIWIHACMYTGCMALCGCLSAFHYYFDIRIKPSATFMGLDTHTEYSAEWNHYGIPWFYMRTIQQSNNSHFIHICINGCVLSVYERTYMYTGTRTCECVGLTTNMEIKYTHIVK